MTDQTPDERVERLQRRIERERTARKQAEQMLEAISDDTFSPGAPGVFSPLVHSLAEVDPFLVMADLAAYIDCQERVAALWQKPEAWTKASVLNSARMGYFSSDRAIREYAENRVKQDGSH